MLTVKNLNVCTENQFGSINILENLNFELGRGESLGLVGESGCGKSMLALAIMGLLPDNMKASGEVLLGNNLLNLSEYELCKIRGNNIGIVFQEPMTTLNPVLSIGFQVAESLIIHKKYTQHQAQKEASEILDRVGLPSHLFPRSIYPHQLSGGQRQRVVVAIAISCKPELIIADEPTTSLDVTIQKQILDLISELVYEEKMSLILITHDLGIVAENTDHMMVMYAGRIVEKGRTKKIFKKLSHPYTRGLFDSIPGYSNLNQEKFSKNNDSPKKRFSTIPGRVPEFWERSKGCNFNERCSRAKKKCSLNIPKETDLGENHFTSCFYPY